MSQCQLVYIFYHVKCIIFCIYLFIIYYRPTNNQIDIAAQLDAFRAEIERLSNQEDALRKLLQPGTSTNVEK